MRGLALGLLPLLACWREAPRIDYVEPVRAELAVPPSRMIAAHASRDDRRSPTADDAIVVVFDRELDATSLVAHAFMVVLADGSRVRARAAVLAPASEDDENRTVTLWGDFGDAIERPPTDVVVIDRVWDEQGGPLLGSATKVEPLGQGPRPVLAVLGTHGCAAVGVRSYWTDELHGVEALDLGAVEIELADGARVHPDGFADVSDNGSDTVDDNVLDLCLAAGAIPRRVRWDPGVFRGASGQPSAAAELAVVERDTGRAATLQDATVDAEVPGGETRPPPNSRGTARGRLVFGHRRTG
ncbi:MAG: hypothetical protein K1X88_16980 [Nannocystaceae bacterium]|nr:hypothetical protein [Nannocystaceae bacterium]